MSANVFTKCVPNFRGSLLRYLASKPSAYERDCEPKIKEIKKKPNLDFCTKNIRVRQRVPDCPRPCPPLPDKAKPLPRLKKKQVTPRIPYCPPVIQCPMPPRIVVQMKTLPCIPAGDCKCVEPYPLKEKGGFKRLRKKPVFQKQPVCSKTDCPVETSYKVKEKVLPRIPPTTCKCVEPHLPTILPPLLRLKKRYVPPPKIKEPECEEVKCPDKPIQRVKKKRLPYICGDCKCVEPPKLTSVPLGRPKKELVCPPPKSIPCAGPEECSVPRADEVCKYKVKEKTLDTIVLCEKNNTMSIYDYKSPNK